MNTLFSILVVIALSASSAVAQRVDATDAAQALVPTLPTSRTHTYFDSTGHPYRRGLASETDSLGQTNFFSYSLTQDSLGNWRKRRYHSDTMTASDSVTSDGRDTIVGAAIPATPRGKPPLKHDSPRVVKKEM